jgi:hypothetical protein
MKTEGYFELTFQKGEVKIGLEFYLHGFDVDEEIKEQQIQAWKDRLSRAEEYDNSMMKFIEDGIELYRRLGDAELYEMIERRLKSLGV